jgi:uncharacterized protein YciI
MQFIVDASDYADSSALERRMAARDAHLKGISDRKGKGEILFAAAKTDDTGKMIGSLLVVDFTERSKLDEWLASEPYVQSKVWDRIEISSCKVPAIFLER